MALIAFLTLYLMGWELSRVLMQLRSIMKILKNNMNKLMSWLETKHNLLLKAYLDFSYEKGEGKLIQSLMDSLSNILPQPVLIDLLKEHLKLSWTDSDSTNATPGNLLKDLDTWTLKNMTKYLGVEQ